MQPCWKFLFVGLVMVLVLMVVVTKADISTTTTTQRPLKKLDQNCIQNFDGSEIKICATNGTDFVSFSNECRLKEANQKKGMTAFKKVALSSCASSISQSKPMNDHPVIKPRTILSKILNKPRSITTHSVPTLVYNVTPMASGFKKVNKTISATTRPIAPVDKVKLTSIHQKHVNKIASTSITLNIIPLDVTNNIDSINSEPSVDEIAPTNNPLNEVTSTNRYPIFSLNDDVKSTTIRPNDVAKTSSIANIKTVNETITTVRPIVTVTNTIRPIDMPINENATMEKLMPTKFHASTTTRPTVTTVDEVMSTTIRPIFTTVSQMEPASNYLKNSSNKLEALIVPIIKPVDDIIVAIPFNKIGTSTVRSIVNKNTTNFSSSKVIPVNKDQKAYPLYPETSANIQPVQMGARKSISCPYAFNPVCATYGGVNATFINECLVNAENVKTGKDWTINKEGTCGVEKIENINQQHKGSTEESSNNIKKNYANSPTVLEVGGDNIMFTPIIERTDYEDGPIVEHFYPSYGNPPITSLRPYNKQSFPSYGTPEVMNLEQTNELIFPSYEAPAISNSWPNTEQSYSSHRAPAMISFENSKQSYPVHATPTMTDFASNSDQSYSSYGVPEISNFEPNNDIFYPSNAAPAMTKYEDSAMKSFENTRYYNPLLNSQPHFMSSVPSEAPLPILYPISDNDIAKEIISFPQVKTSIEKRHAKIPRQRKYPPCARTFNPVCAIFAGVKSTFNNECLVNAENIKTGSAWIVFSRGVCAEEYSSNSNRNKIKIISTRSNNENLYKAPQTIEQEYGPDIIYVPPIFETEIIEDPYVAQNYDPSSEQKIFKNSNDYLFPLMGQANFEPVQSSLSDETNLDNSNKYNEYIPGVKFERSEIYTPPFLRTNSYGPLSPEEKNFEGSSQFATDIRNLNNVYTSVSAEVRGPLQYESNYAQSKLPIFSGTEQNAAPLSVVTHFESAPQYAPSSPVSPNSEVPQQYKPSFADVKYSTKYVPPFESVYSYASPMPDSTNSENPHIYGPFFSSKEIEPEKVNVPYAAKNYDSVSEQDISKSTNNYSPPMPGQTNYEPSKWYASLLTGEKNIEGSNSYNKHIPGVQFERSGEYNAPFLGTNSYSPLSPEENKFEDASLYAPDVPNAYKVYTSASAKANEPLQDERNYVPPEYLSLRGTERAAPPLSIETNFEGAPQYASSVPALPNFEVSAQYEPSFSGLDSTNYAPQLESVSNESPNKYAPLSLSKEIELDCRPSTKEEPIPVVDENVLITKLSICNFRAVQLPICGSFKNEKRSFRNMCELMLRNVLRSETWAPIYEGRCRCPEVCSLGIEPICVSRNGVMETISNMCNYERLKSQDPFSSWQYHFKGECFSSPSDLAFRRLTKPMDPLTIKVPNYENINLAFPSSEKIPYPTTPDDKNQKISSPVLKYPSEFRGCREIKTSSTGVFEKKSSATGKADSKKSTRSAIPFSSSSTKAPVTTTTTNPNFATSTHPYDQITTTTTTTTATKATTKLIPYKKPIVRFVVSAKKSNRPSIYSANPNSAIMRLTKPKAFSAVNSKSARFYMQNSDRS